MFDSHCHLTDMVEPETALLVARQCGVDLLCCGYDPESNAQVLALRKRSGSLSIAVGLHPWYAAADVEPVLRLIEQARPVAIGEAGLDLWAKDPDPPLRRQVDVLEAQLHLARQLDLPVTLHSRKAASALLPVVRNQPGLRGALHAYSGSWEQLRPLLDLGLHLGVGGAVTRPHARRVRDCASRAPLDRILLETDAPAIGMQGLEPSSVRPEHVRRVAEALAELRTVSVERVEEVTDNNARSLFGILGSTARSERQPR